MCGCLRRRGRLRGALLRLRHGAKFCKKSTSFLLGSLQRAYQQHAGKSEDYRIKFFCGILRTKESCCVEGSGESGKGMSCDESLFV